MVYPFLVFLIYALILITLSVARNWEINRSKQKVEYYVHEYNNKAPKNIRSGIAPLFYFITFIIFLLPWMAFSLLNLNELIHKLWLVLFLIFTVGIIIQQTRTYVEVKNGFFIYYNGIKKYLIIIEQIKYIHYTYSDSGNHYGLEMTIFPENGRPKSIHMMPFEKKYEVVGMLISQCPVNSQVREIKMA